MVVNVQKLMTELESAGIPVAGCASDGRIDFKAEATPVQRELASDILAAHDPNTLLPVEVARKADLTAVTSSNVDTLLTALEAGTATPKQQQEALFIVLKALRWLV